MQCSKECSCEHDADCDPVSGVCVCRAGWFGNHCTQGKLLFFVFKFPLNDKCCGDKQKNNVNSNCLSCGIDI